MLSFTDVILYVAIENFCCGFFRGQIQKFEIQLRFSDVIWIRFEAMENLKLYFSLL